MKTSIFTMLLIWSTAIVSAQTLKDLQKEYDDAMNQMQTEHDEGIAGLQKEYDDFVEEMDNEFREYLKNGFQEFEQFAGQQVKSEIPKPVQQPTFIPASNESTTESKPLNNKLTEPIKASSNSLKPIIPSTANANDSRLVKTVDYFGITLAVALDEKSQDLGLSAINPSSFSGYWNNYVETNYYLIIESVVNTANDLNLNDWGVYQLIKKTSETLFDEKNDQVMWTWATLNKTGYQAKLGYVNGNVYIMLSVIQQIYEAPYYTVSGNKYYVFGQGIDKTSLSTYTKDFAGATKKIDLSISKSLNFSKGQLVDKSIKINDQGANVEYVVNQSLINYLNSFPQTDHVVYLNASLSRKVKEPLFEALNKLIDGKTEEEAVSIILSFVQHSFEYKTDHEQFGKERMFFPDEMMYYEFSDCEDRTVLFTYLVNNLVGIEAVAVRYPGHMAAAVAFSDKVEGVNFILDDKSFTICDPTYVNAPIGSQMPSVSRYEPVAIKIITNPNASNIWNAISANIENGNEANLFIAERSVTDNDKYLMMGWFEDQISVGGQTYNAIAGSRDLWMATYDESGELLWFLPINCEGNSFPVAFAAGKKGNAYALISHQEKVLVNGNKVSSSKQGYLILGVSGEKQIILNKDVDTEGVDNDLAFYGKYNASGVEIDFVKLPTDGIHFDSDIFVDAKNDIVVRGAVGEVSGISETAMSTASLETFNSQIQLDTYIREYNSLSFNKQIAGVFASLKLLSQSGSNISGDVVKETLDKNNPDFKKKNPNIYNSLSRMKFVVNKGGVINIQTEDNDKILLDALRIKNNSNMRITKVSDSIYKVSFLSGVEVGKAFVWFDLNDIIIKDTGTLVFDYDDDHTKKNFDISDIID